MPAYNEPPTAREQQDWSSATDHAIWPGTPDVKQGMTDAQIIAWNLACLVDSVDTLRQSIEKLVPNPFTGRPA